MTKNSINVILYSYRSKNLKAVVDALFNNTDGELSIHLIDQHPLNRPHLFEEYYNVNYQQITWDYIYGQCFYRGNALKKTKNDYVLMLSDDVIVSKGWDTKLIDFINDRSIFISGSGTPTIFQKDPFSIKAKFIPSSDFSLTQYIDKNFIFASRSLFKSIRYPEFLKYNGEAELLSIEIFTRGLDIYSCPEGIYQDLMVRTIDNLYVPFSKDHNYNTFIDKIRSDTSSVAPNYARPVKEFLMYHNIDNNSIYPLPYPTNDVDYDPNNMAFDKVDGRRFIAGTKAIR